MQNTQWRECLKERDCWGDLDVGGRDIKMDFRMRWYELD
jgi:hypothetical protein